MLISKTILYQTSKVRILRSNNIELSKRKHRKAKPGKIGQLIASPSIKK